MPAGASKARDKNRTGCGARFADDRILPGMETVERGELDYLAMQCLAERTIARETPDRAKDPGKGYTQVLLERMEAIMHRHCNTESKSSQMGAPIP
jgi:hypothetical protein